MSDHDNRNMPPSDEPSNGSGVSRRGVLTVGAAVGAAFVATHLLAELDHVGAHLRDRVGCNAEVEEHIGDPGCVRRAVGGH